MLRADALAVVAAESGRATTLFSHHLASEVDWSTVLGSEIFASARRGPVATAVPAGRWVPSASYAIVSRVDLGSGAAYLIALREQVPFDAVETLSAQAAASLLEETSHTQALLGRSGRSEPGRPSAASPATTVTSAIKVLAVEDHPIMRVGLRATLEREGLAVVGTSATCAEAIGLLRETAPDVVLLDLGLSDASGPEAVARVREAAPRLPIVVYSDDRTPATVRAALRAGAHGFVTKDAPIAQLVGAIIGAAAGLVVMGPEEAAAGSVLPPPIEERPPERPAAIESPNGDPERPRESATPREALSPRELELLRYMAEGYTNKEMARAMVLAEDTVKKAVQTLIAKLGATDRTHAVVIGLRLHLID